MTLSLDCLPDLVLTNILSFLQPTELCSVALACKRLNTLALQPGLFRHFPSAGLTLKIMEHGLSAFLSIPRFSNIRCLDFINRSLDEADLNLLLTHIVTYRRLSELRLCLKLIHQVANWDQMGTALSGLQIAHFDNYGPVMTPALQQALAAVAMAPGRMRLTRVTIDSVNLATVSHLWEFVDGLDGLRLVGANSEIDMLLLDEYSAVLRLTMTRPVPCHA